MSDLFDGVDQPQNQTVSRASDGADSGSLITLQTSLGLAAMTTLGVFLAFPLRALLGWPAPPVTAAGLYTETLVLFVVFVVVFEVLRHAETVADRWRSDEDQ